jgi:predicted metal-dependent hydrolase
MTRSPVTSMNDLSASVCQIRRSARAKRLRLVVKPGLIELVVPLAASEGQALAFLDAHRAWAEDKARQMRERVESLHGPAAFAASNTIPWRGREIPLLIQEDGGRRVRVAVDEAVRICLPEGLRGARDEAVKRALYVWVRRWLRERVAALAALHGPRHGLHPREIRVKRMKTRWGSCGPRNDININWLLAFVPDSVLEYVVVHELCHIRERNHSAAFWTLVGNHLADYARERRWLRSHGAGLMHRFG